MRIVRVDPNCYLVEWRYKDFLRLGHEFQGGTIIKIERHSHGGTEYARVFVERVDYKI